MEDVMSQKEQCTIDLKERQRDYLRRMVETHNLPDESKAIRILIDFAMHEPAEEERIFTTIRCAGC
jgi:hypothetical protein